MKKWEKGIYIFTGILFFLICISAIIIYMYKDKIEKNTLENARAIMVLGCLIVMVGVIIPYFIKAIMVIKNGMHNIKKCDDELFENIDKFKHSWGESNENYIKLLQIINLYYKPGGKVEELIRNKEIERLLKRKDFLLKQRYLFDDLSSYFYSLVISVIASFLFQMLSLTNPVYLVIWMILILGSFITISFLKYAERGNAGSYKYLVEEYEKNYLDKKIEMLDTELLITVEDERILATKQIVIDILINKRLKAKKKKDKQEIEQDIKIIEKLQLCLGDYSGSYIQTIFIDGQEAYLAYDINRGLENNYIGKLNLKTVAYSVLYEIMEKYNVISFISEDNLLR